MKIEVVFSKQITIS